jgi:flagellar motility protein MotE (MotC chaperone)
MENAVIRREGLWIILALFFLAGWECSSGGDAPDGGADASVPDGGAPDSGIVDADQGDAIESTPSIEEELFTQAAKCPEPSALVQALRKRARQLDERAQELEEREHSLKTLSKAVEDRLAGLEKTRDSALEEVERLADIRAGNCREQEQICEQKIASLREEYQELEQGLERWDESQKQGVDAEREQEIARLTKAISAMRPEKAAATLSALDRDTAAELISALPERSSGKIFASLDPTKTAAIVETLLAQPSPAKREQLREVARVAALEDRDPASAPPTEEGNQ